MKAIIGATLIDGTGSPEQPSSVVLINDSIINTVGNINDIHVPENTETIEANGLTLLPGLIDCHDHLAQFTYDMVERMGLGESPSKNNIAITSVLNRTLESGYTTVRDAAGLNVGYKQAVDTGLIRGPNLQVTLNFLTIFGGQANRTTPSGHTYSPPSHSDLPGGVANGPAAVREMVRELVRMGADAIKTATTGWASEIPGLGPIDPVMHRDELEALVDEAHLLGRRVLCHAIGGSGQRLAVEVGVDSLDHGCYLDEDPDLIQLMLDKQIFYVPTFSVFTHHSEKGTPQSRFWTNQFKDHHSRSLRLARDAGIKIAAGTDEGGWQHGNNARELGLLVQHGLSPMEAIVAATGNAAACLGLQDTVGTIEPGKTADIILVSGNPLKDISILEWGVSTQLVMKGGSVVVDRRQNTNRP
ncbi:amidohydrolase family protein [SAR202 cluster bacterium AD-804-J14_MRT_500m]|nr:amidohydrolase family protein [SAR202 cluster bacterium AD-804-J14_MRT_500m]